MTLGVCGDECTYPQICNGVGTTLGKCVTPIAGQPCQKAGEGTLAGEYLSHIAEARCRAQCFLILPACM